MWSDKKYILIPLIIPAGKKGKNLVIPAGIIRGNTVCKVWEVIVTGKISNKIVPLSFAEFQPRPCFALLLLK